MNWSDLENMEARIEIKVDDLRAEFANCVNRDEYTKRMASLSKRIKEILENNMTNRGLQ